MEKEKDSHVQISFILTPIQLVSNQLLSDYFLMKVVLLHLNVTVMLHQSLDPSGWNVTNMYGNVVNLSMDLGGVYLITADSNSNTSNLCASDLLKDSIFKTVHSAVNNLSVFLRVGQAH